MAEKLDNRVIKRIYPRENNDSTLTFVVDADPNLCLEKNRIQIHFEVDIDDKYMPENGFASKLFIGLCSVPLSTDCSSNWLLFMTFRSLSVFQLVLSITESLFSLPLFTSIQTTKTVKVFTKFRVRYQKGANNGKVWSKYVKIVQNSSYDYKKDDK